MKNIKFNGNYLELYDSIRELPIDRFNEYNRYLMLDSGIGSGGDDIARKVGSIQSYLNIEDIETASKELQNLYHALTFTVKNVSPKMYSFCVLIKSINGKEFGGDLSKERLDEVIKNLGKKGFTYAKLEGALDYIKKKLKKNLRRFFRIRKGRR